MEPRSLSAFSDELQKIATNRMEREISAGNIQRSQVVPGAVSATTGVGGMVGRRQARNVLQAPSPVAPDALARRRAISQKTFDVGLRQPHVTPSSFPGLGPATVLGSVHVPPDAGGAIRTLNSPLAGTLRFQGASLHPALSKVLTSRPKPVDTTVGHAILRHEEGERSLMHGIGPGRAITPAGGHLGARPLMEEQMAARGDPEALSVFKKLRSSGDDALIMKRMREAGGLPGRPLPIGGRAERAVDRGIGRSVRQLTPQARANAWKAGLGGANVSYLPKGLTDSMPGDIEGLMAGVQKKNWGEALTRGKSLFKGLYRGTKFIRKGTV